MSESNPHGLSSGSSPDLPSESQKCKGYKSDGGECQNFASENSDYCWRHDPDRSKIVTDPKGALENSRRTYWKDLARRISTAQDVRELILMIISEVKLNRLSPVKARAMNGLMPTLMKTVEVGELEKKIRYLEDALNSLKNNPRERCAAP